MKVQFTLEVDIEEVGYFDNGPETEAREILYSAPAFDGKDWIDHLEYEGTIQ